MGKVTTITDQVHAYVSKHDVDFTSESMARMVKHFIEAEREACAKVCEELFDMDDDSCNEAEKCAEAIRMRSNANVTGLAPRKD